MTTVGILCLAWAASTKADDRPNIVLVMADDQGWGDMAYNGHPVIKTPNFDEAAAAGLRMDRFYAAAPVCSPTRASVMTGRHPNRMGVFKWGYPIRPQEVTVAEALRSAGYATAHFGKWHLGSVRSQSPAHPGRNGFDFWVSAPNFYDNNPILSREGKAIQTQGESSIVTADLAIDWIRRQTQRQAPFLAVVWFGSPHGPHRAADEDRELYSDQPNNLQNFYGEVTGMDRAFGKLRSTLDDLGIRDNTVLWYCSDNGALPGVGSSGGRRGNKGKVYEGGLLVPSILEWPARIAKPRTTDLRGNTCDIYPTVLEIAGVEADHQPTLDGVSLLALVEGDLQQRPQPMGFWDYPTGGISTPSDKWMSELLAAQNNGGDLPPHESSQRAAELPDPRYPTDHFPGHAAWIDGDWKLHRIESKPAPANRGQANGKAKAAKPAADANPQVKWELYNLADDPNESEDLAKEQADRAEQMGAALEQWLTSVVGSLNGDDYEQ